MPRQYRGRIQRSSDNLEEQDKETEKKESPIAEERQTLKDLSRQELAYLNAPLHQGPPPKDSEKQRLFYQQLVLLKASRMTDAQCAEAMGVSVSSIANYKADPLFDEMHQELVGTAKERGYLHISSMIDPALATLLHLMESAKSEFTRFSAAKALLEFAGYNISKEDVVRDGREGVVSFLAEVENRRQQRNNNTIIQVQVNTAGPGQPEVQTNIVEAGPLPDLPDDNQDPGEPLEGQQSLQLESTPVGPSPFQALWTQTVLPGGRLPPAVSQALTPVVVEKAKEEDHSV